MKTSFFFLFMFTMICFSASEAKSTTVTGGPIIIETLHVKNEGGIFKIKIHYERGRKNEQGQCHDRGVCKFELEFGFRSVNPGGLNGEIQKDRYGNVVLVIEKGGMVADEAMDITGAAEGQGTLYLSNNSDLPTEVKTGLGLPAKYQFKAGNYQVTETSTTYIVNFGK